MKKKIRLTLPQLKKILRTEQPHYPIRVIMYGIDKEELMQLIKILKDKDLK